MATRWRDPLTGTVILLLAGGVYWLAGGYNPAAALFPRLIAIVMMLAAAGLVVRGLLRPQAGEPLDLAMAIRTAAVIGLTIVYVVAVASLGYLTASAVFIPVAAWVLGVRRPLVLTLSTLVFLLLVAGLFLSVFKVPLPRDVIVQLLQGRWP